MNLEELKDLDPNNPGGWPLPVKMAAYVIVAIVLVGLGYWFLIKDKIVELEQAENREPQLRQEFETKQRQAASLPALKLQMDEIQQKFGGLLAQLPNQNEVDRVLDDISQTRVAAGVEERLFKPEAEITRDFYAELPIEIELTGTYAELGAYIEGIADLSRIVTLHRIKLDPEDGGSDPLIEMELTAKTYRYLEDL